MRGHITEKILHDTAYDLTQRAQVSLDFLLLTVSAGVICALGFSMNNASIIVGAMVISPLLFPVICAAVATYHANWNVFSGPLRRLRSAFLLPFLQRSSLAFFTRRNSGRRSSIA